VVPKIRLIALVLLAIAQPAEAQLNFGPMPSGIEAVFDPLAAEKSCRSDAAAEVCAWLGISYLTGTGVKQDHIKANELLVLACGLSSKAGCEAYEAMEAEDLPAQRALAQNLNLAACQKKRGGGTGCFNAAQLLRIGYDLPQDLPKASALYAEGCDQGHGNSCRYLAEMAYKGMGTPVNMSLSFKSAAKGCALDVKDSCAFAIMAAQSGKVPEADDTKLALLSQIGCRNQFWALCYNAGAYALKGLPAADRKGEAASFFQLGCDGKAADSCVGAGIMARDEGDKTKAAVLFRKAPEIDPTNERAKAALQQLGG